MTTCAGDTANLKTRLGLITSNKNLLVSLPSKFWYPGPAPFSIRPRSRKGPQTEASGRASGIWEMRILGPGGGSIEMSEDHLPMKVRTVP